MIKKNSFNMLTVTKNLFGGKKRVLFNKNFEYLLMNSCNFPGTIKNEHKRYCQTLRNDSALKLKKKSQPA